MEPKKTIPPIAVAMVKRCSVLTDYQASSTIAAFQAQINEDVAPIWSCPSIKLSFVAGHEQVPAGVWPIYLLDTSDQPGAGGFHEDTGKVPDGKVFCADAIKYGINWTVDFSHELIEMLVDPQTNRWVPAPGMPDGWQVIVEPGDPVEDDACGYEKNGVLVSNFVTPAYYGLGNGKLDFRGRMRNVFPSLMPGGYVSFTDTAGNIRQITARRLDGSMSRRATRISRVYR